MGRPENYYVDDAPVQRAPQVVQAPVKDPTRAVSAGPPATLSSQASSARPTIDLAAMAYSAPQEVTPDLARRYGLDSSLIGMQFGPAMKQQDVLNRFPGLSISSGYRDQAHNALVGGVPGSLHTRGLATDFTGPEDLLSQALAYVQNDPKIQEALVHDAGSGRHLHTAYGYGKDSNVVAGREAEGMSHTHGTSDEHTHVAANQSYYSVPDMEQILQSVGFTSEAAKIMAAVGMAESSGDPSARALTPYEDSRSLFQINLKAHPQYKGVDLTDPYEAAKAAYEVSNGGTNFGPWTMFTNGRYKEHLDGEGSGAGTTRSQSNTGAYEQSTATQGIPGLANAVKTYQDMQGLPGTGAAALIQSRGRTNPLQVLMSNAAQNGISPEAIYQALLSPDDTSHLADLRSLYSFLDNPNSAGPNAR